jgi:multidrug efflux pump subunit AcrA (membrane-fusion protein)
VNARHILAATLATASVAACSEGQAGSAGAGGGRPPTPVEVTAAITDTVVDAIYATGEIEAVQSIEVRPEVTGRLTEILHGSRPSGTSPSRHSPASKT